MTRHVSWWLQPSTLCFQAELSSSKRQRKQQQQKCQTRESWVLTWGLNPKSEPKTHLPSTGSSLTSLWIALILNLLWGQKPAPQSFLQLHHPEERDVWPERLQESLTEPSHCRLDSGCGYFQGGNLSSLEGIKQRAPPHWGFPRCDWAGRWIIAWRVPAPQKLD